MSHSEEEKDSEEFMDNKLPHLLFCSFMVQKYLVFLLQVMEMYSWNYFAKTLCENCIVLAITYTAVIYYSAFKAIRELV